MFIADLHIHSKFSRACSKDCDIEHLSWWALRKGLTVLGTGDFTHPAWSAELKQTLVPAEPGLFRIHPDLEKRLIRDTPGSCAGPVRFFILTTDGIKADTANVLFAARCRCRAGRVTCWRRRSIDTAACGRAWNPSAAAKPG